MWCLAINLPLMIGGLVPDNDEHWALFCDLLEIIRIIFAPAVSHNLVAYLQVLIQGHHERFKELYPGCPIIPKMHYMIHMPRAILRFGPLIRSWCMRFEAKHPEFKRLAINMGNYINLPYSLTKRHQECICYRLQTSEGSLSSFITKGIETGPCGCNYYAGDVDYYALLSQDNPKICNQTPICEYKWVSVHGTKYKVGCILQIGADEYDVPIFGKVVTICMVNRNVSDVIFVLSLLHTVEFNAHYQSYEVSPVLRRQLVLFHQSHLNCFLPLNKTKPYGVKTKNSYIVPKFEIVTSN
mgnify:FL=1